MTEIEEKFYRPFDIKPVTLKDFNYNTLDYDFKTICINEVRYPKITAEILLKLMWFLSGESNTAFEDLKNKILNECIEMSDCIELKQQVKSLFEGEGEE